MHTRGFARGLDAAQVRNPSFAKSSSADEFRAFLRRTASAMAIAAGTSALAAGAHAAGLDIGPGQTYNVVGTETYDYLNISSTGTLNLGNVNDTKFIAQDNGVNTTWSGFITALNDNEYLSKTGNGTVTLLNLKSTGGEIHINGGTAQQTSGTNQIWILAVGSNIPTPGTGTFNISGGTLNIKAGPASPFPAFQVGHFGGTGYVNQTDGAVNFTSAAFNIGNQGGNGTYNLMGGTITLTGGSGVTLGRGTTSSRNGTGILNVSGGLFDVQGGSVVIGNNTNPVGGTTSQGIINQSGGTVRIGSGVDLYIGGYSSGTYNLNGGTLEIGGTSLHANYSSGTAPSLFNLGGGTIKVIGSDLTTSVNATLVHGTTSTIDTTNANATWSGKLLTDGLGMGNLTKIGGNTLTLGGVNTYTGLTTVAGGTLKLTPVDSIATSSGVALTASGAKLDVSSNNETIKNLSGVLGASVQLGGAGKTFTFGASDSTAFAGDMTGTGSDVTKKGSGTFTFGGTFSGVGYLTVNGGTLATTKSNSMYGASPVTHTVVQTGATWDLTGAGLQTVGDFQLNAGSTLAVTLGNGHDTIVETGANLAGALNVHRGDGSFPLSPYLLMSGGNGSIANNFSAVTDDMPLITITSVKDVNNSNVKLVFSVAGSIADLGSTPNEKAVGGAINTLGSGNSLYDSLVNQTQAGGQFALQQLAGDFHATTKDALILDTNFLAGTAGQRLDYLGNADGGGGADPASMAAGKNVWLQGYGQAVNLADSSGNAGDTAGTHIGLLAGLEGGAGNWAGGVAAGAGTASIASASRNSSGKINSVDLLAYAGDQVGAINLRMGGSYSFNTISTTRTVLAQTLTANYKARTGQVFGEVGADLGGLTPFVGANYINIATDAFSEAGGPPAAISAAASTANITYTTLGLRAEANGFGGASVHGMAGWRHAFGDLTPISNLTIQSQGYTVSGVPIAADALVAEAGVDINVNPNLTISAGYSGQLSAQNQDHGGRATATLRF
ncbi:MAG TPA: autotransporter domain-containing protein [Dongiaceae bacterium]|nr:autotransporter domain-containing protein [Dongiaceae bacterium]